MNGGPNPLVDGQQGRPLEALPTLGAAVGPLPGVVAHVVAQARRALEGLPALRAAVRALCPSGGREERGEGRGGGERGEGRGERGEGRGERGVEARG